jgi:site-specific DNA-methyltransferase (adenine-specific)
MTPKPITRNTLFYGDNLGILRDHFPSECVDLIYLDPPFNSNRSYNVLFKTESGKSADAQIQAFDDTWHWGAMAEETYDQLTQGEHQAVASMISAMRQFIGTNQMMAYLVMMAARLVELHRVLKPTGSLYLHCDPTASHYLKILLDTIFGVQNFRNEIIWKRSHGHNSAKRYGSNHDVILFYSKTNDMRWNDVFLSYDQTYLDKHYSHIDSNGRRYKHENPTGAGISKGVTGQAWHGIDPTLKGRHWARTPEELERLNKEGRIYWPKGGEWPYIITYLDTMRGVPAQEIWSDIDPINMIAAERLGYPTQKPIALLERIIQASSNPGDIVLDPFSGCGTAITAAQKLGRRWIGIDITHLAISMHKNRLKEHFNLEPGKDYDVIGEPEDLSSARQLAQDDRYQFQWWALSLIKARPLGGSADSKVGKKGSDQGIDGVIPFIDDNNKKLKRVIVSVKSGHVNSGMVRDLHGVIDRETDAPIGVFITLEEPSRDMNTEAVSAGFYTSPLWQKRFPRLQMLTIEQLLAGAEVKMPPAYGAFKQAEKIKKTDATQGELELPE